MREKLRELDGMRVQLSAHEEARMQTTPPTPQSNLVKIQEAYAEARRHKQELESTLVPLRQDLNNMDLYAGSAMRVAAQESTMEGSAGPAGKGNEEMERDVKAIPTLQEQNELLRTDLNRLRQRYKEENEFLTPEPAVDWTVAGRGRCAERDSQPSVRMRLVTAEHGGQNNPGCSNRRKCEACGTSLECYPVAAAGAATTATANAAAAATAAAATASAAATAPADSASTTATASARLPSSGREQPAADCTAASPAERKCRERRAWRALRGRAVDAADHAGGAYAGRVLAAPAGWLRAIRHHAAKVRHGHAKRQQFGLAALAAG